MTDNEERRGSRAIISSGGNGLDSDDLKKLGSTAISTLTDRGDQVPEIAYLQEYAAICEQRLTLEDSKNRAEDRLDKLNERFPNIPAAFRKTKIPGPDVLVDGDEQEWMGSSMDGC